MSARQAARWKRAACPALARDAFSKSKIWGRHREFGIQLGELRLSKPLRDVAGERPGGARRRVPDNVLRFLQEGNKVKVSIRFRGREMGHPEIGLETMKRFAEVCSEVAAVEKPAKMEGRNMLMFLAPKPAK